MKPVRWIYSASLGLVLGAVALGTGCVGYVGPDGATVIAPEPEVTVFGGGFGRYHDVHAYSHRGFVSRGYAHGGGFHHR